MGEGGGGPSRETVEGKDPKWRPEYVCEGETALCQSKEGEPWNGRGQTIVFQVAVSLLLLDICSLMTHVSYHMSHNIQAVWVVAPCCWVSSC
jgi:hypothetical protein